MSNIVRKQNIEDLNNKIIQTIKMWKPIGFGEYIVRFLPPREIDGLFFEEAAQHKVGDNYIFCPRIINNPCLICETRKKLYTVENENVHTLARKIKARKVYLYNIILRVDPAISFCDNRSITVHIYMSGTKLWRTLISYFFNRSFGDLTDVDDGYDFVIVKNKGFNGYPDYTKSEPLEGSRPLADNEKDIQKILSNRYNLKNQIKYKNIHELESLIRNHLKKYDIMFDK